MHRLVCFVSLIVAAASLPLPTQGPAIEANVEISNTIVEGNNAHWIYTPVYIGIITPVFGLILILGINIELLIIAKRIKSYVSSVQDMHKLVMGPTTTTTTTVTVPPVVAASKPEVKAIPASQASLVAALQAAIIAAQQA